MLTECFPGGSDPGSTLSRAIFRVAQASTDKTAIVTSNGNSLTYGKLLAECSRISHELRLAGVRRHDHVAVYCCPGPHPVCALLSIISIGAVYVPLDSRHATEYLAKIIADAAPRLVLVDHSTREASSSLVHATPTLDLDIVQSVQIYELCDESVPSDPAFILYTSGTTGSPKGCILTNENFQNQYASLAQAYGLDREIVLQQAALSFDVSLEQIFCALASGGTLAVAARDIRCDSQQLAAFMYASSVTLTIGVPSEYMALLQYGMEDLRLCDSWRWAICGGERMTEPLALLFKDLKLPQMKLLNCYGPTEVCFSSTFGIVDYCAYDDSDSDGGSTIGYTLPTYSLYICNDFLEILPHGKSGEICIGGRSVFSGYLNQPDATSQKLKQDVHASVEQVKAGWGRLYRTGDKGHMSCDGKLVFEGRLDGDAQFKIRGNRIEPEQVEHAICEASNGRIREAIATVQGIGVSNSAENVLVAIAVVSGAQDLKSKTAYAQSLLPHLALPEQMKPSAILAVESIPRTAHGKKDRKAAARAPVYEGTVHMLEADKLETPTQKKLAVLWRATIPHHLLDLHLDADSDFFQVGGNSLLVMKLKDLVEKEMGCCMSTRSLFQNCRLSDMAQALDDATMPESGLEEDWSVELDGYVRQLCDVPTVLLARRSISEESVILTGASGFLGSHILRCLVQNPKIARVICIAKRPTSCSRLNNATAASDKITVLPGNLQAPALGLAVTDFDSIMSRASSIIHVGAEVSFLKSYQSMKATNVQSVVELLKGAIRFGTRFHFVSTAGLAVLSNPEPLAKQDLSRFAPLVRKRDGYIASKWMAEQVIGWAANHRKVSATIHRPTSIVGPDFPKQDALNNLLETSLKINALPDMHTWKGYFNFVDVEDAANSIALAALDASREGVQIGFQHHCAQRSFAPSELQSILAERYGQELEKLQWDVWLREAQKAGLNEMVYAYLCTHDGALGQGLTVATNVCF